VTKSEQGSAIGPLVVDVDKLRIAVGRVRIAQIQSAEVKGHIKAVATAWFKSYRITASGHDVAAVDKIFSSLLTDSERSPSTQKIRNQLKQLRRDVVTLQTQMIVSPATPTTSDVAPTFGFIPDPVMRDILIRRWNECVACLGARAPIAATVMMGGLLESLFLARVNREPNQSAVFTAKAAPKDNKAGQTQPLNKWGLGNFIAVAHELKWITQSGKDVSEVLQNYRNYIHPQKELSSQASLTPEDAHMLWAIAKAIAIRLI
jgi:hypothetical protein